MAWLTALMTCRHPREPERRVAGITASDDGHTELDGCEQCASYACSRDRSSVEIVSLDDEIGDFEVNAEASHLPPETPIHDRSMEITDRLAFGSDPFGHEVVADFEREDVGRQAQLMQRLWYS